MVSVSIEVPVWSVRVSMKVLAWMVGDGKEVLAQTVRVSMELLAWRWSGSLCVCVCVCVCAAVWATAGSAWSPPQLTAEHHHINQPWCSVEADFCVRKQQRLGKSVQTLKYAEVGCRPHGRIWTEWGHQHHWYIKITSLKHEDRYWYTNKLGSHHFPPACRHCWLYCLNFFLWGGGGFV